MATQLAAFQEALARVDSEAALYELQVAYLGKKGTVTQLRGEMGKLPPEARKGFGAEWNRVRDAIEAEPRGCAAPISKTRRAASTSRASTT